MDRSKKVSANWMPENRTVIKLAAQTNTTGGWAIENPPGSIFAQLTSESVFAKPLDILVEDGYITQTSSIDKETDTRLYQDVCNICAETVWEYAGHFHETKPTEIAEWFSANSPRYHVSTKCAAHFYEKHPDELALATLKASI